MGFFDKIKKAFTAEKREEKEKSKELNETSKNEKTNEATEKQEIEQAREHNLSELTSEQKEIQEKAKTEQQEKITIQSVDQSTKIENEQITRNTSNLNVRPEVKNTSSLEQTSKSKEQTEEKIEQNQEDKEEILTTIAQPETEASIETKTQKKYEKGLTKTRKTFSQRLNELFANFRSVDEDFFEELEETLIGADVGFETSLKITDSLRQEVKLRNVKKPAEVQNTIIEKMVDLYEEEGINEDNSLNIQTDQLTVMLFVGVNGVGKTTSIGKLAYSYKQQGKKVVMAAADTFRAGAIDQLIVWGERANVKVIHGKAGGDPAAVVYDSIKYAKEEQADILLIDTAGRLQNKVNLMNELEKIKRVIQREIPEAPHEVLLVIDATTGQNAMSQVKQFKETTDVTGLILTKLDGTAKGGIIIAILNELHLPVKLVGLGEGINDLEPFSTNDFAIGLFKGLLKEED